MKKPWVLSGCPGWSECFLGAQVILFVLSYFGSYWCNIIIWNDCRTCLDTTQNSIKTGIQYDLQKDYQYIRHLIYKMNLLLAYSYISYVKLTGNKTKDPDRLWPLSSWQHELIQDILLKISNSTLKKQSIYKQENLPQMDCCHWTRYPANQQKRQSRIVGKPVSLSRGTQPKPSHRGSADLVEPRDAQTGWQCWWLQQRSLSSQLQLQVPARFSQIIYIL